MFQLRHVSLHIFLGVFGCSEKNLFPAVLLCVFRWVPAFLLLSCFRWRAYWGALHSWAFSACCRCRCSLLRRMRTCSGAPQATRIITFVQLLCRCSEVRACCQNSNVRATTTHVLRSSNRKWATLCKLEHPTHDLHLTPHLILSSRTPMSEAPVA